MAKRHTAFEHADAAYAAGQQVMAGHALKHLAAASACYAMSYVDSQIFAGARLTGRLFDGIMFMVRSR